MGESVGFGCGGVVVEVFVCCGDVSRCSEWGSKGVGWKIPKPASLYLNSRFRWSAYRRIIPCNLAG